MVVFLCLFNTANAWEQGDYFLEFNPKAYTTEYFEKDGRKVGNCAAATIVTVEAHINLWDCIPDGLVKAKTEEMIKNFGDNLNSETGIYEYSVLNIINQLEEDGYTAENRTVSSQDKAKDVILDALSKKHWLIVLCRYNFTTTGYGHYYPLYGAHWTGDTSPRQ